MKRLIFVLILMAALPARAEKPRVFVSILPQKHFVERVAGDRVEVEVLVGPGRSPATYEPTPKQMSRLSEASLFVSIGVPFEKAWLGRIAEASPGLRLLDGSAGIEKLSAGHDHQGHGHDHGHFDPHVWTDPLLVKHMAGTLRDALTELDPAGAGDYARGCEDFGAELEALDAEIRALLEDLPRRRFMVFHASWSYFARRYGLEQIAIEDEGHSPGARSLAAVIDRARSEEIPMIFVQEQFSRSAAEAVAQGAGARVLAVDPLAEDYAENLRGVARAFAESMR